LRHCVDGQYVAQPSTCDEKRDRGFHRYVVLEPANRAMVATGAPD
jgi:hypothetical protein